jgi:hypothetical protein
MGEGLTRLLEELADGRELSDSELGAFSDLDRASALEVKRRWPQFQISTRALLLERAGELADVNLDLNFEALGKLALDDPDPEVRERAVNTLWESEDPAVASRFADLATTDAGPGVRAAAAQGLLPFVEAGVMDRVEPGTHERVVQALRKALLDQDVGVRAAALEAAGPLPDEWVGSAILEGYESDERELRVAALRAMGASGLDRWAEYIADQLYSGETEMRLEAVLAAGALGSDELVVPLGEALGDDDPEVVLAVIEALGEIGGEEAIELLNEFAPDVPEGMEEALETARGLASEGHMFRRFGDLDGKDELEDDEE